MIEGRIDRNLDARVTLPLMSDEVSSEIEFILDTGFNGYVALSMPIVERFGLKLGAVQSGITADGRTGFFDTVHLEVKWFGSFRLIEAQVLDEPLIGTRLLNGHQVQANWLPGGKLIIAELP